MGQPFLPNKHSWTVFSKDLLASLVVFLVALPLCMGIAIACNLPPAVGIITGVIGGCIVGLFSGAPLQVSGPAAGLVVIILELVHEHGLEKLGLIIFVAGVMQLLAGFSGLAKWFRAVPPAVLNGMLSGIGVLIFASQFHVMLDDSPKGSGITNLISIPHAIFNHFRPSQHSTHDDAAYLGLFTIAILILWDKFAKGKLKIIPGSLVAVAGATAVAFFTHLQIRYVSIPYDLMEAVSFIKPEQFSLIADKDILLAGLAIALVASAETLLSATALDKLHRGPRCNYDKELTAQGIGNTICGLLGALPMTGVIVRSGVNVAAGARTRMSAVLHGLWLLLFVSFLPFVIKLIPVCTLAALLVYTGYKLANFKIAKELWKYGQSEVAIYAITLGAIVTIDLLTGVLIGIGLSVAKLLYIFSHLEIRVADDPVGNRTEISLKGAATFLSLPLIAAALDDVRPDTELHVHLEGLDYTDHACLELLMNWDKQHRENGGVLVIDWGELGEAFTDRRMADRGMKTKQFRRMKVPAEKKLPT